jgi:hypothetical protein
LNCINSYGNNQEINQDMETFRFKEIKENSKFIISESSRETKFTINGNINIFNSACQHCETSFSIVLSTIMKTLICLKDK